MALTASSSTCGSARQVLIVEVTISSAAAGEANIASSQARSKLRVGKLRLVFLGEEEAGSTPTETNKQECQNCSRMSFSKQSTQSYGDEKWKTYVHWHLLQVVPGDNESAVVVPCRLQRGAKPGLSRGGGASGAES
jgi:hypothetical protein